MGGTAEGQAGRCWLHLIAGKCRGKTKHPTPAARKRAWVESMSARLSASWLRATASCCSIWARPASATASCSSSALILQGSEQPLPHRMQVTKHWQLTLCGSSTRMRLLQPGCYPGKRQQGTNLATCSDCFFLATSTNLRLASCIDSVCADASCLQGQG